MGITLPVGVAFQRGIKNRDRVDLRLSEHVRRWRLIFAIALLRQLNIDARRLGRDGGKLDQTLGRSNLAIFQLQPLRPRT